MSTNRRQSAAKGFRWAGSCAIVCTFLLETCAAFNVGAGCLSTLPTHCLRSPLGSAASFAPTRKSVPKERHPHRASRWLATSNVEVGSGSAAPSSDVEFREGSYVVDGFRSYYCVATPSANVDQSMDPIVFVHSAGSSSAHFKRNLEPLAAELRCPVYAVDLLGYGQSGKPMGVLYSPQLWAWQLETFITEVIEADGPAFLVGHALGGYVSMDFAASNPKKVQGLAVIAPSARYGVLNPSGLDAFWYRWGFVADQLGEKLFQTFSDPAALKEHLRSQYTNPDKVDDALVQTLASGWKGKQGAGKFVFKSLYTADPAPAWEQLVSEEETGYCGPLLAVWGREDGESLVDNLEVLRELQPRMEQLVVDAGHYAFDEKAEEVNSAIAAWVRKHAGAGIDFPVPFVPRYKKLPLNLNTLKL